MVIQNWTSDNYQLQLGILTVIAGNIPRFYYGNCRRNICLFLSMSGCVAHPAVDEQVHDGEVEEGQQPRGQQPEAVHI